MYKEYRLIKITEEEVRKCLPARPKECHKGDFGYVALIGGSMEYSGAIRLAAMANAAMRSGAGVASIAAPKSICPVIAEQILEATLIPLSEREGNLIFSEEEFSKICRRYDVIAFGMGIGLSDETVKAAEYLLSEYEGTLIVDADGLNALAKLDKKVVHSAKASLVLTPHMKEFSRLSGMSVEDIKEDAAAAAAGLAEELNAVVLLKGSTTYVAEPADYAHMIRGTAAGDAEERDGDSKNEESRNSGSCPKLMNEERICTRIMSVDRGCPGMATAGSGDVLSGILAALCACTDDLTLAAAAGAYINGLAGEIAEKKRSDITMTSADTALSIAEAIETIRK